MHDLWHLHMTLSTDHLKYTALGKSADTAGRSRTVVEVVLYWTLWHGLRFFRCVWFRGLRYAYGVSRGKGCRFFSDFDVSSQRFRFVARDLHKESS